MNICHTLAILRPSLPRLYPIRSTSNQMASLAPSTTPVRVFEDHERRINAVAVLPDQRRMVTSSEDNTLRLWDLKEGAVLKKMVGHHANVKALAVSQDGQLIASGDLDGELNAWHGDTGDSLTPTIQAHENIYSLDFSPDGSMLASGSWDDTTKLWNTTTWQPSGAPISCGADVNCVRYSPSGKRDCVAKFEGHAAFNSFNYSLAWTPDATCLLSAGTTIRAWDSSTWEQVGHPWRGHTDAINSIVVNASGTLLASASSDKSVRFWRLSDRPMMHSSKVRCVAFSVDGKHILSGGDDLKISEWKLPKGLSLTQGSGFKILVINAAARNACITGDLPAAIQLFTQQIDADPNNFDSYANRSFVMARQLAWKDALQDATKSVSIEPSLIGHISKGLSLCGNQQVHDAMAEFDLAFAFTNADPKTTHFLFLIKAIALFNTNPCEKTVLPIQELAARPNADPLACRVVEAYMRVQLGTIAMDGALHSDAAGHFTAAVNAGAFFSKLDIHYIFSAGTSSPCGKPQTNNAVTHSFGQVKLGLPSKHIDICWT
ncbi:WD40-repeat-containing domain protein [Suillus plorans]|uniref:WD40-repeat-containing domain protein n=1 Tax=Suillus plorans TaxID=116603 RepID=A0A9P7DEH0_9AGAM|nr:WD40-repeat-containing domain protein [Suillus plorans]KAG1789530.1 WD40-repeat-containing domain protein [Suillus plorans]